LRTIDNTQSQETDGHVSQTAIHSESQKPDAAQVDQIIRPLELHICGRAEDIYETLEQFAWLSAALRFGSDHLSYSRINLVSTPIAPTNTTVDRKINLEMKLAPLRTEATESPGTCWVPLFDRSVLAWGFEVAERGDALGLEMTFALMLAACGTAYPTEYNGAQIISRDWITIYPCRAVQGVDNGFEWHAVNGTFDEFFLKTTFMPVYPLIEKVDSVAKALSGRMFVGWARRAKVMLATGVSAEEGSALENDDNRGLAVGETLQLNAGVRPPFANLVATVPITIPRAQREIFEARNTDPSIAATMSKTEVMLYYDVEAKTGWLLPELSFVLHLAFARLIKRNVKPAVLERIRYAEAVADGGQAAFDAFVKSSRVVIGKRKIGNDAKEYTFADVIQDTLDFLDSKKRSVELRFRNRELLPSLALRGWDFEDLRDTPATFYLRILNPSMGRPDWWDLAKEPNTLVVFANRIGQAIAPMDSACSSWQKIPTLSSLLVSTVRSVHDKARARIGKRPEILLTSELAWHQPLGSRPFEACHDGHLCNPVQKVRRRGGLHSVLHGLRNPDDTDTVIDGATIFGEPANAKKMLRRHNQCNPRVIPILRNHQARPRYLRPRSFWTAFRETTEKYKPDVLHVVLWYMLGGTPFILFIHATVLLLS
jgi:hypothetical protein